MIRRRPQNILILSATALISFGSACSSANLKSSSIKSVSAPNQPSGYTGDETPAPTSDGPSTSPSTSPSNSPSPGAASPTPATVDVPSVPAVTPSILAGASLLCSYSDAAPAEARCESLGSDGKRKDYVFTKASIIQNPDKIWVPTAFKRISEGFYSITVPTSVLGSFAVSLSNDKAEHIADWIVKLNDPIPVNVVDHSFEAFIVDTTANGGHNFVKNGDTAWKVDKAPGSECVADFSQWEIHSALVPGTETASAGKQWAELNSYCNGTPNDGSNIVLSQAITLNVGHSYQIVFDYRKRWEATGGSSLGVGFDTIARSFVASNESWATARLLVKATLPTVNLTFMGLGEEKPGIGALIDNVRVYDLGVAK